MEIKKVALIEPVGGHGGMDYYDYGLAYGLGKNQTEVEYHTCNETRNREFENVTIHYTFQDLWRFSKLKKFFLYLKYHNKAFIHAKKNKLGIIHLHFFDFHVPNFLVLLLAKFYPVKTVVTVHDVDSFHAASSGFLERMGYRLIDGVIVHNQSSFHDLTKKKFRIPQVKIVPHGNYQPFVNQLPLPSHDGNMLTLLFFGQIKEVKGLDILLEALSIVVKQRSKVKLIIAGRPWKTDKKKYLELIHDLDLEDFVETHFRYIEDDEIETFFQKSDLVVLPYRRIYQSGVLLLTMSYGRAVISSDLPAFTEIITHSKNGFTFKEGNPKDLANCILNSTPEKIRKVTLGTKETIAGKYDWINIGKETKDFYNSL